MKGNRTPLNDCLIIQPTIFEDDRGLFFEAYQNRRFKEIVGSDIPFVQTNHSVSKKGVLRGLHFQKGDFAQAKLVWVVRGKVLDVVVDLRPESSTFGKHFKVELSDENRKSVFIPRGMAHGFLTLSDEAIFTYQCDNYYHQPSESGIHFKDPVLNIDWRFPEAGMILSEKDRLLPKFKEIFP